MIKNIILFENSENNRINIVNAAREVEERKSDSVQNNNNNVNINERNTNIIIEQLRINNKNKKDDPRK